MRITAKARLVSSLDASFPEVEFMDSDRPHENTLDALGWGVHALQADRTWLGFGVDGSGVTVGHIDAGAELITPASPAISG